MKKTLKRFLAFAMVAVMMANPMSALAAQTPDSTTSPAKGSADASGDVEGFVDTTIFKVVLPTSAEGTFDFIMDPQGLIAATSGDAYTGATFGTGNVFFNTASANASGDYKNQSNFIEVLNKGTVAVNVSVEATVTGLDNIAMVSADSAFTSGDAAVPELYLAFVASGDASGDAKDAPKAILTNNNETSATINAVLPAASADFYEFNYASGEYTFDLKTDKASGDANIFPDYSFALTGACNSDADWTAVKTAAPAVKVVWTLEDADATSTIPESDGSTAINIVYTGTDPVAGSITFITPKNTSWTPAAASFPSKLTINSTTNTLTISAAVITTLKTTAAYGTGTYKVTINGQTYSFVVK